MLSLCTNCDGQGTFIYREGQPEHSILNPRLVCPKCHGTGKAT